LKPGEGPIVLVLAPTRELAVQIKEECDKFGASSQIKNTVVYGGVKKHTQVKDLQSGVEIVIVSYSRKSLIFFVCIKNTNPTYVHFQYNHRLLQVVLSII
jgi:superfamily II DNA or RNA helicase